MGADSGIEWTDATWNAVTGCTEVSPGCDHCYARTLANGKLASVYGKTLPVVDTPDNRADTFAVRLWPDRMDQPRRWRKPRRVFVNSMSDFFHADTPEAFQREMFAVMLDEDRHTYQILTKRPGRALRFYDRNHDLFGGGEIPAHIWMGATVENQAAVFRAGQLLRLPAAVRFLSCEPLLGPLDLTEALGLDWEKCDSCGERYPDVYWADDAQWAQVVGDTFAGLRCPGCFQEQARAAGLEPEIEVLKPPLQRVHWVIAGGESGPGHRPPEADWFRSLRDQCVEAGVAFFFKQWGGHTPKAGGRELDGRTWDEYPDLRVREMPVAPAELLTMEGS